MLREDISTCPQQDKTAEMCHTGNAICRDKEQPLVVNRIHLAYLAPREKRKILCEVGAEHSFFCGHGLTNEERRSKQQCLIENTIEIEAHETSVGVRNGLHYFFDLPRVRREKMTRGPVISLSVPLLAYCVDSLNRSPLCYVDIIYD